MTRLEHVNTNGRPCTYVIGADAAGHCEELSRGSWALDVTVTHDLAKRIAYQLPDCVAIEPLAPGYLRLTALCDRQSATRTLTVIAELH